MTRAQALGLIRAAGIAARFTPAPDDTVDDEITLLAVTGAHVQISAGRDGLVFLGNLFVDDGDDTYLIHGKATRDPVAAAREALAHIEAEGERHG